MNLKSVYDLQFTMTQEESLTVPAAPHADPPARATARDERPDDRALSGSLVGVLLGLFLQPDVPFWLEPYLPIAVVAALDAVFGALRAFLDGIFDDKVFVVSFVSNVLIAALIVYLGDQLGVGGQLSTGVIVVLGHPDLLQRRRDPPPPVPCLTPRPTPTTGSAAQARGPDRAATGCARPCARRASRGQAVVGVLLAVLGFAAVVQVRANDARRGLRRRPAGRPHRADQHPRRWPPTGRRPRSPTCGAPATRCGTTPSRPQTARRAWPGSGPRRWHPRRHGAGGRARASGSPSTPRTGELGTDQLLNGLQELRDAGAEAIEINDKVRVVAQTGIVEGHRRAACGRRHLRCEPPYVIDAIGDPHTLATALDFDGGFIEEVEEVGGERHASQQLDKVEVAIDRARRTRAALRRARSSEE